MGLTRLIFNRFIFGLITLLAITLLISLALEALPGDFAEQRLGQSATPETVAAIRDQLGLNKPVLVRYAEWLGKFVQGDMGVSLSNNRPVAELLATRLGNTLFLAVASAIVAVPLALLLGIVAALYRETLLDKLISTTTLAAISLPEFFIGYILVALLAVNWQIFPAISSISDSMSLGEKIYASLLPIATLTFVIVAHMMRMTRAAIINLMQSPYIEMATLKGLKRFHIIVHHALPNALSPIINVIVLNLAYLVVGVVVVEVVFIYPGLGLLMIDSVTSRDLPIVQACILIFGATYITLNMLADILAIICNPRMRHPR